MNQNITYLGSFLATLTMLISWNLWLESSEFLTTFSPGITSLEKEELTLNSLQEPEISWKPRRNLLDMIV